MSDFSITATPESTHRRYEDNLLIADCLNGEESAYLAVYNQYAAAIYRLCRSLLQHREDAEEVLLDTFEYAFRRLEIYDSTRAGLKTWLYQIAVSRCRNKRRRKLLPTIAINQLLSEQIADEHQTTPAERVELSEKKALIWDALGSLSPKLRETAVLRYYENFTYKEIGLILSIPQKTAESRMRLAHMALKEILENDFGAADE